jgi:predicted adenine nucleotide alpha hydrolase (AANH) superfamily ATPase
MKTLLHICCAPCSISCIEMLRGEGIEPVGYWNNPNIQPYTEYRSRRNALVEYAQSIDLALVQEGEYGLRKFLDAVGGDYEGRCQVCYDLRMGAAAAYARSAGFDSFTSTLFVSPYQNHEKLKAAAQRAAREYGVEFLYRDFRPGFRAGQDRARELGLYMQKYCGCIFSEEERYRKRKKSKRPPIEQIKA